MLLPVLLLGLLEIALRIAGYGYATPFFKPLRIEGEEFLVQNDQFSLRFFPPEIARNPGPIRMKARKDPGTCRIFIFGESAAMGDPEPSFGAGRYLEMLLRQRFPEAHFEVVNVAFTAINSHVIVPLARECAKHEGDLWIVYMGNNEMIGPFGAATVFGPKAPSLPLVHLMVGLQRTRVGQLIVDAGRHLGGKSAAGPSWGGMQMFLQNQLAPDDRAKKAVYRHFRSNLEAILRAGLNSGAHVLLNTVAVNLKDCPPFASHTNSALSGEARGQMDAWLAQAVQAQAHGDYSVAASRYEQVCVLDPLWAEPQFRRGQCLLQLGAFEEARTQLQVACDNDALPFRADSTINRVVRELGEAHRGAGLKLIDTALTLAGPTAAGTNTGGIAGREIFYEHVHFNFDGNYRLGRAWAEQLEELLPAEVRRGTRRPEWATQQECETRLGLTDWNRSFVLESVVRRLQQPPLSSQLDQAARLARYQDELRTLREHLDAASAAKARGLFEGEIQRRPDDYNVREGFADFLEAVGDFPQAEQQWRRVGEIIPQDFLARYQLGRMLARQNRLGEARAELAESLKLRPSLVEAWIELGRVEATAQNFKPAVEAFDRATRLRPQDPVPLSYKAKALSNLGRRAEAMELYRRAIVLSPNYWEAHNGLGDELATAEKVAEAAAEYEIVVRLNPGYAMAHLNLGVMLVKRGRMQEGRQQFEETLKLEPGNSVARQYLEQVSAWEEKQRQPGFRR